ncbi:MAG: hypothetical protein FJX74_23655, partial [Armatimonadetes bacterium]|nr:hypothetical protein [Armatimonadota bacterium]
MPNIRLEPAPGQMAVHVLEVPAFPGESFHLGVPEAIGDVGRAVWFGAVEPRWEALEEGAWRQTARREGELSYTITLTPLEDVVDIRLSLTNESNREWAESLAFNCFGCGGAGSVSDHECVRHWCGVGGELRRLIEVPRRFSPRATVQLYSVEGAPPGGDLPFVAHFAATPEAVLEGWLAIQSRDGTRLVATASRPTLFLFQNMEYSCIHAAPSLGPLQPGETGEATNLIYFVEDSLEAWRTRMRE